MTAQAGGRRHQALAAMLGALVGVPQEAGYFGFDSLSKQCSKPSRKTCVSGSLARKQAEKLVSVTASLYRWTSEGVETSRFGAFPLYAVNHLNEMAKKHHCVLLQDCHNPGISPISPLARRLVCYRQMGKPASPGCGLRLDVVRGWEWCAA